MLCTSEIKSRKTPENAGKLIQIENVLCTSQKKEQEDTRKRLKVDFDREHALHMSDKSREAPKNA